MCEPDVGINRKRAMYRLCIIDWNRKLEYCDSFEETLDV